MYPFHSILSAEKPHVRFFVVDARPLPSGRAQVNLTVLVSPFYHPLAIMRMYHQLNECMTQEALKDVCEDIGVKADLDRTIGFSVLVLPEGGILP